MSARANVALDPVADLSRQLARQPGRLRGAVMRWWHAQGLGEHPAAVGKPIALALIAQRRVDDKLAGIMVLHELLADHLRASDLPAFARMFETGQLADRNVVDGFAARVLGTMLERVEGRREVARALVQWRDAETAWQRRAACLAFLALARHGDAALPGLAQLIFTLCSGVVWSTARRDQSAVAALLCELSRAEPIRVEAFVRRHARFMSRDCMRGAIARLPAALHPDLVAHWKRATSLRR